MPDEKNEMPVIDLANDENDDWMKKANPDYRTSETAIHEKILREHQAKQQGKDESDSE